MLSPPDLRGDTIALRPWRPDDLESMVAAVQDPDVTRWTSVPDRYGDAEGRDYLDSAARSWADGTAASFAIVDTADGALLGSIGIRFHGDGAANVGYWMAREARGRGVATQALRLVSAWALTELPVERLELVTAPDNEASQRVAEKAGFTREGLLRRYVEIKGKRRDAVVFSLLPDELV
jgi:RimJ/RimL family protein N-acetyltransferase